MAQVYHHSILPLCDIHDKRTEVLIEMLILKNAMDVCQKGFGLLKLQLIFKHWRFWQNTGLLFTILAPRQAKAVAEIDSDKWTSVDEGSLDTSRPYLCELPSGKTISLFFYHGDLAMEVAFRGALDNGERFCTTHL